MINHSLLVDDKMRMYVQHTQENVIDVETNEDNKYGMTQSKNIT